MRAHTEGKYEMGKRFATVIGVAAAGVMALGAQAHGGLIADEKQELGKAVKVTASCGDEACTARAKGELFWATPGPPSNPQHATDKHHRKLKPASADLGPGETTTLKLKLTKKTRKRAGEALDEGKIVGAKVKLAGTDAAGNAATADIRLVK